MLSFWERLRRWKREALKDLGKRWWWVLIVAPTAGFVWALISARIVHATNKYIDSHVTLAAIRPALHAAVSLFSGHPFVVMLEAIVSVFLVIVAHAYWISSKKSDAAEQPDVALVWDWGVDEKKVSSWMGSKGKSILVDNRTDRTISRVQVDSEPLRYPIRFDEINEILPKTSRVAVGRWDVEQQSQSTTMDGYNHHIMMNSDDLDVRGFIKPKSHNRGISSSFVEIPMSVTFDSQSARWKIEFDFHYDPTDDDSCFSRKRGYKVETPPAA
jgi:hypothetical protein